MPTEQKVQIGPKLLIDVITRELNSANACRFIVLSFDFLPQLRSLFVSLLRGQTFHTRAVLLGEVAVVKFDGPVDAVRLPEIIPEVQQQIPQKGVRSDVWLALFIN
ncbi:hypothetical protein TUM18999_61220 [Pseudomonas tohonis]|uniref:Uncharacterized protein n=1 Tax=Pseudomonas tohonis TaxID=2725477 RepID=A0A6J4EHH6_9PSED|nr:hypothetical protein TUM18999_61220 [Pseudomonas tohonis]GJN52542.1 hypothetical protein TUM20286_22940 [Pseudomonas tohonis]